MSNENEPDWLMSVFDMERILASAPSRKRWDIARHILTHVQDVAASSRRPILSDEAVERAARALHQEECDDATAEYKRNGLKPPEKWADPWIPSAKYQREKLERYAIAALTAAFSPPPEPAPSSPVSVEAVTVDGVDFAPAREWISVPEYFVVAVNEFLSDWQKGDFSLSTLASLDAQSIIEAKERWAVDRPTPPTGGSNG